MAWKTTWTVKEGDKVIFSGKYGDAIRFLESNKDKERLKLDPEMVEI